MACQICLELELYLALAQQPDQPELLEGLSQRALDNRILQRAEAVQRHQLNLKKHANDKHCANFAPQPA